MGSSAAAGQQGQPQQMHPGQPQQGGPSKGTMPGGQVMDYSMGGGNMALYGGPNQMPGGGMPSPINNMTQPGGPNIQYPQPGQGQGDYQQAVMPYPGQMPNPGGDFNAAVMPPPGQGGVRSYDLQPGDGQPGGLIAAPPQQRPGGILDSPQNSGMRSYDLQPGDYGQPKRGAPPGGKTRIDGISGPKGKVYNPNGAFQGLSKGTMPSMKKHVQAGKMGQAKKAFEAGGGKWTKDVHKRLKKKYS